MILPFEESMERARSISLDQELTIVLEEIDERLQSVNSAIAVDSARQILKEAIKSKKKMMADTISLEV